MQTYKVRWTIDLDAENAVDAVREAKEIQQDLESTANYFQIITGFLSALTHEPEVLGEVDLDDDPPVYKTVPRRKG